MPWKQDPNIWGVVGAILISLVSGFLSVASALVGGHKFSFLWLAAQLTGACLAGWLVWDMFPAVEPDLPAWITQPIATSLAAHYGGKCFSILEKLAGSRLGIPPPNPTP
jgi:hypothetical protein